MKRIQEHFAVLLFSRRGATAIEYGLIASLIAIGAMAGIQGFGVGLADLWNFVSRSVLAVTPGGGS